MVLGDVADDPPIQQRRRSPCGAPLARVKFGPLMEPYGDAVPSVHQRDGVGDVGHLLVVIVARQRLIGCVADEVIEYDGASDGANKQKRR